MREISAPGTNVLGRHGCRPRYLPALFSFVRCRVGFTVVLGYDRMNHCVFDGGWTAYGGPRTFFVVVSSVTRPAIVRRSATLLTAEMVFLQKFKIR